jgi:3',5'-nucleoside bisphosphate phosphatase
MLTVRADLHIHTVLSPCASLDMSPARIVREAVEKKIDIIGITDHNSTLQCKVIEQLAEKEGILVMKGAEVNTREEIHCLAFFPDYKKLGVFQDFLDHHLHRIPDRERKFGYQVLVDENDQILEFIDYLLVTALDAGIEEVSEKVHELGGIFIPAHIDRLANGIISQIGFIPPSLKFDALEITSRANESNVREKYRIGSEVLLIRSSDAHFPEQIGSVITQFTVGSLNFNEIKRSIAGINPVSCRTV